jgi:acetyl-CoA carboxylase biotin carboxylase subunit
MPSPKLPEKLRKKMGDAAVKLCKEIGYENCGTIEFLVDNACENFYFMEMNTRIQVEHPITEEVYGCDLIKEQIRIAAGLPLSEHVVRRQTSRPRHRVPHQCRRPFRNFAPSPGKINLWYTSGGRGVRVDTHVYAGYKCRRITIR